MVGKVVLAPRVLCSRRRACRAGLLKLRSRPRVNNALVENDGIPVV